MKRATSVEPVERDPSPYDGPLRDMRGRRPFNRYLYPTEDWWAYHEPQLRWASSRWHFGIVALADGRFAVNGFLWAIEKNDRRYSWTPKREQLLRANNFESRTTAIRTAAADLLRLFRAARRWDGHDGLEPVDFADMVNWLRWVVARATDGRRLPPMVAAEPPPLPPPILKNPTLLDVMEGRA